jgi:ketosteroid isomerase-like protein
MLTREMMDRKLDEHFAFEMRDDIEGVLSTLAQSVEHDVVGWPTGPVRGHEATRSFYTATFADLADGEVRSVRRYHGEDFLVDESIWSGIAVGRPFGFDGRGRPLTFRLLHILEFTRDGQIARENVWFDSAAIARQLPQD